MRKKRKRFAWGRGHAVTTAISVAISPKMPITKESRMRGGVTQTRWRVRIDVQPSVSFDTREQAEQFLHDCETCMSAPNKAAKGPGNPCVLGRKVGVSTA